MTTHEIKTLRELKVLKGLYWPLQLTKKNFNKHSNGLWKHTGTEAIWL